MTARTGALSAAVIRQRYAAAGALNRFATGSTADKGSKPTTILQQDDLFTTLETGFHFQTEHLRKNGALLSLKRLALHIDHVHGRQGPIIHSIRQAIQRVFSLFYICIRL